MILFIFFALYIVLFQKPGDIIGIPAKKGISAKDNL